MIGIQKTHRIGFLATQFDESYQNAVWTGAVEEACSLNLQLIFFEGSNTETQNKAGALDETAFSLASSTQLDALIVMTNTMGSTFSRNQIEGYLSGFSHIPIISIGVKFPHLEALCANTKGEIALEAAHLIEVHKRSSLLFLAGPKNHPESEQRKKEFLDTVFFLLGDVHPSLVYGDFLEEIAYDRILACINNGWCYDAVVAANDQMALGAIRALEEHDIRVPQDVSVTGFDDIPDSISSIPPLTTIHQPAGELGKKAVRHLAKRLGIGFHDDLDVSDLSSAFIIRQSCGCVSSDNEIFNGYECTTESETIEQRLRSQVSKRVSGEYRTSLLRRIESAMVRSFSMEDILKELADGIKRLGLRFCAVVMFDTLGKSKEWSNLMMITKEGQTRVLTPYGLHFLTSNLLPDGFPPNFSSLVCEPLQFGDEQIGYLLCSSDAPDRHIYATLRDILSTSLKGSLVMAVEKDRELSLEKEVRRRTVELSLANKQLKDEIAQRKLLERELLENSNNIMTRIGQDIHDDLCQDIAGIGVMAAVLKNALKKDSLKAECAMAEQISQTALSSAYNAKQIARDLYPADLEENGIMNAVYQLAHLKNYPKDVAIDLDIQQDFFVREREKAFQLYRIIQESLNNSIKHSQATKIKIGMYMDHGMVTVEVSDNGVGFDSLKAGKSEGMGLKILKYRANLIGARLRIHSSADGTVVSCRVSR